jgi:hypothetical protein
LVCVSEFISDTGFDLTSKRGTMEKTTEDLIRENDKRALVAERQRSALMDLKISTFSVREFLDLTHRDAFTASGQAVIKNLYDKYINNET